VPKKPDDRTVEAFASLLAAHSGLTRRLNHELEEAVEIPLPWYEVLLRLYRAPDRRLRMQELVDSLFFTPSGVTRLTDRLCDAGYVRREKCAADRRGTFAVLTDEGLAMLRKAGPVHLRGIQQHFGRLISPDEADAITAALGRVTEALQAAR
jgi:DNA-binding MarR family transcriptional regulator